MPGHRSLAELAAELEDPRPTEIDPETIEGVGNASSSEEESDSGANREHYEAVGKSKLRKSFPLALGPEYVGSSISREELYKDDTENDPFSRRPDSESDEGSQDEDNYDDPDQIDLNFQDGEDEDIDSDDAFGDGEEEMLRKKGFTFRGSGKSSKSHEAASTALQEQKFEDEDDSAGSSDAGFSAIDSNVSSDDSVPSETEATTDAESDSMDDEIMMDVLRSTEQKQIVASLSKAVDNEAKKGLSIRQQYATSDTLIGARIHLQKSLIAANSINATEQSDKKDQLAEAAKAAESAALDVLNTMTSLLHSMQNQTTERQQKSLLGKRPFSATIATSSEDVGQALAVAQKAMKSRRRAVFDTWEKNTQHIKLSNKDRVVEMETDGTDETLVTRLDRLLLQANQDRLIEKTRIPRSCAPHISESNKGAGDTASHLPVYDDADFYTLLLRELIDHKKTITKTRDANTPNGEAFRNLNPNSLLHTNKSKRANVDTKASKGRKMKYVVHEKLQNFMAPVNLGTWEARQAEELFASLLGRKVTHVDEGQEDQVTKEADDMEMQGLRLFGGV